MFSSSFEPDAHPSTKVDPALGHADFARLVERSFAALQDEQPRRYRAMCLRLSDRALAVHCGDESFGLDFNAEHARVVDRASTPCVVVRFEKRLIVDLIMARISLHEAILSDRLSLVGELGDLVTLLDGLSSYLQGAVRAQAFRELWSVFQAQLGAEDRP